MKLALCNEVIREKSFAEQCAFAAALGYEALEVAPFTLASEPAALDTKVCTELRRVAAQEGIEICGLHWLLVAPPGLSLNGPDDEARQR
ncbi:MAG: sugar phosphate isomerase/epimerase family protein, partial [Alphaproteobacteria bacterium]